VRPALRHVLLSAIMTALAASCAPAANAPPASAAAPEPGGRNVLAAAEIEGSTQANAYDLIRDRRPAWLRSRGLENFDLSTGLDVYVDGTRMSFQVLGQIPLNELAHLEYLSASDATLRFGTQEGNPAILVTTKRGR